MPTEFGLALRDLRVTHLNMTTKDMGVHLGVRQQEVSNLENGQRLPTEAVIRKAIEIAQRIQMIQAARKMGGGNQPPASPAP